MSNVITDFATASSPKSDIAKKLATEAQTALGKERRQGGIKDLASGRSDTFRMNPYLLAVQDGWNARAVDSPENQEHIDTLAKSIAKIGVLEPLTVFWDAGKATLTDGHCRLLATFRAIETYGADIKSIPVKTEAKGADEADRLLTQIVRNSGKALTTLEKATVFKRLMDFGWSAQDIADKSGVSATHVSQIIDLQSAPKAIKEMVKSGKVSATLALHTVKNTGSEAEAVSVLEKAVAQAQSVGSKKVMPKHVKASNTAPIQSFTKLIKEKIKSGYVNNSDADGEVEVAMKFSAAEWAAVVSKLNLKL